MSDNKFCKACNKWWPLKSWPMKSIRCSKCRTQHQILQQDKKRLKKEIANLEKIKRHVEVGKSFKPYKKRSPQTIAERLEQLNREKQKSGCYFCGEREICCLDYHHVYPEHKTCSVREAFTISLEDGMLELAKCLLVCSNCHRKIHTGLILIPDEIKIRYK